MTDIQKKILKAIKEDYMTCDDIAFITKKHRIHIGKSMKSLLNKGYVRAWYDYPNNPKYINILEN